MAESRFERWSRLKSEAREEVPVSSRADDLAEESRTAAEQELAINEQLSEQEVLSKYELPDPDDIQLGTDIKGFLSDEIPEALRRRALRSLWRSNPVLAVLDGLNDYDEDFSFKPTPAGGIKTLYKVGQGMFEKVRELDEKLDEFVDAGSPIQTSENLVTPETKPKPTQALVDESSEVETAASDEWVEAPESQQPRYRPRMRFDF